MDQDAAKHMKGFDSSMTYKTKGGKLLRRTKRARTLYHFTPPANLPSILKKGIYPNPSEEDDCMLPGFVAVWLTSNPNGNEITEAHLGLWCKRGCYDLIADFESGRRRFLFGDNAGGSARITLRMPENFQGLYHYLSLITANTAPEALAIITDIPRVDDWWVVPSPADGEIFTIGPGAITEVVGEPTPEYIAAGELISRMFAEGA
jgi:hypothetical protein